MPVLIHLAPRTPGPGRLRRGRGPRTRLCTPGSPRGRCAIARACALGGPTELRLSPAGTPGGRRRATGAPRRVFRGSGARTAPQQRRTHKCARGRASRLRFKAEAPAASGRCRREVAGRAVRTAYCNSEPFRKESRGSQTAPQGREGREGECSRKASMERRCARPPADLSDKTGNGGRG